MDTEALKETGLSDIEIKIYLSLLKEGRMIVSKISEKTGIYRPSVYDNLIKLIEKGLVSHITISGKKYFKADTPKKLIGIIDEKKERLSAVISELENLVPSDKEEFEVEVLEGKEGLKTYMEDMLKHGEESKTNKLWGFGGAAKLVGILKYYLPNLMNRAIKKGLFEKVDMRYINNYDINREYELLKFGKNKFTPKKYGTLPNIEIFGNTVNILHLDQEIFVVRIKNGAFTKKCENLFKILWGLSSY